MSTDRTLTPADLVMIDAIVDPIRRERAAAPGLAARYDAACERVSELHAEAVSQRRRIEGLEDQIADRDTRITELEKRLLGTLARRCSIPGCDASYDAFDGPPPEEQPPHRHWMLSPSPSLTLCPDHSHLWPTHRPRLDHDTRACACTCGHPLPGPTLGHMGVAWIAHALAVLEELAATALTKLGNRAPRCDKARIQPPRFGAAYLHIEQCRLTAGHRGDHQPGMPEPVDAATALTRHDQAHGLYEPATAPTHTHHTP